MALTRTDLLKLDPDTRAFALVGAFMGHFALLEQGINEALGSVLRVTGASLMILTRNMTFDEKVKALRTVVNHAVTDEKKASEFERAAKRASQCGELRNQVAHTPFRCSPTSDGVEFFPIKASSKLHFPDMDWSIDEFLTQIDNINDIDERLRSIEKHSSLQRLAELLMQVPPEESLSGEGALGGLFSFGNELADRD